MLDQRAGAGSTEEANGMCYGLNSNVIPDLQCSHLQLQYSGLRTSSSTSAWMVGKEARKVHPISARKGEGGETCLQL